MKFKKPIIHLVWDKIVSEEIPGFQYVSGTSWGTHRESDECIEPLVEGQNGALRTALQPLLGTGAHGRGWKAIVKSSVEWVTTRGSSGAPWPASVHHQRLGKIQERSNYRRRFGFADVTATITQCNSVSLSPWCCVCIYSKPWHSVSSGINGVNVRDDVWVGKHPKMGQSNLYSATQCLDTARHRNQDSGILPESRRSNWAVSQAHLELL